jgi:hypothetical protein
MMNLDGANMKNRNFLKLFLGVLAVTIISCSGLSIATPTNPPPPIEPTRLAANTLSPTSPVISEENGLEIVSTFSHTDEWGGFFIVGELRNNSNSPRTSIELGIEIVDSVGNSLLKDENGNTLAQDIFSPLMDTLAQGESSPFNYYYDTSGGAPESFNVSVTGSQETKVDRTKMEITNIQMVNDGVGSIHISGEIINQSDHWAHINALAVAVLDGQDQVVSTDWSGTYATELAPKGDQGEYDRSPFIATIPDPGIPFTTWKIFLDAEVIEEPEIFPVLIELTSNYFDEFTGFHIIGKITNNGTEKINVLLVAGLYDQNSLVLDADYEYLPIVLEPGTEIPFDLSNFSNVNFNPYQANKVDSFTVQMDPYSTYPATDEVVSLETLDAILNYDAGRWNLIGSFRNNSGKNLSSATVVASIYDEKDRLVATNNSYIFPDGDLISQGDISSYDFIIYGDPLANYPNYKYEIVIQGVVE